MRDNLRHDKCKCGKFILWDIDDYSWDRNEVVCNHCKTKYRIESDSVLVHWLEEKVETKRGFSTEAR